MEISLDFHNYKRSINLNYLKLVGSKISKWFVVRHLLHKGRSHFLCVCECGTESLIPSQSVANYRSSSCKFCAPKKHGLYGTREYRTWVGARNRCNNPQNNGYVNYGGRGIRFSKKWDKFEDFLKDMGKCPPGLSLDRIDNDGHYEPGNCRWATQSVQNSNQRRQYIKKSGEKL